MKKIATKQPDFAAAKTYAIRRLTEKLSPDILYHSKEHTTNEVVKAVERMILEEHITDQEEIYQLLTAAYFHDLGYTEGHDEHELSSARIASDVLPDFGFSEKQVQSIVDMILATRLPQSPNNLFEEIMADADLDILGTDEMIERNGDLRKELESIGQQFSDSEWFQNQLRFLDNHDYFTSSTSRLRDSGKRRNIQKLKEMLKRKKILTRAAQSQTWRRIEFIDFFPA